MEILMVVAYCLAVTADTALTYAGVLQCHFNHLVNRMRGRVG